MRDGEGRGGGVLVLVPGLVRLVAGMGTVKECMECDDVISRMYMYICIHVPTLMYMDCTMSCD